MPSNRSNKDGGGVANCETNTTYGTNLILNRYGPEEIEFQLEEAELKHVASRVFNLFVPVSLCMAMVVFTMNTIPYYSEEDEELPIFPFDEETDSIVERGFMSLGNALLFLLCFVLITVLYIVFFKYTFYKLIRGWLIVGSCIPLFLLTTIYVQEVLKIFDVPLSAPTVLFGLFYLITTSALLALVLIKYLSEWTVWSVLFVMSMWDIFAVLSPKGPLSYLTEIAQERNEPIFLGLIYSSTAMENPLESRGSGEQPANTDGKAFSGDVQLGFGDFLFYSLLIGQASLYSDWITTSACFVAILVGLCFTLVLMEVFKRALPGLPISIFMGLIFVFCTRWIITPFVTYVLQ